MSTSILWRRLDLPGHELARLESRDGGWRLSGTAVFLHECGPSKLDYCVDCDASFRTTSASVRGSAGDREVDLVVSVGGHQKWTLNGVECPEVEGCTDIDLGFSPSTNLLPIRRLTLGIGEAAEVRAAWLPFPALTFELLPQVYRREGERSYRYESAGGRFVRTIEVNDAGLVADYPGIWTEERIPSGG
jgi:hypothetical protein